MGEGVVECLGARDWGTSDSDGGEGGASYPGRPHSGFKPSGAVRRIYTVALLNKRTGGLGGNGEYCVVCQNDTPSPIDFKKEKEVET